MAWGHDSWLLCWEAGRSACRRRLVHSTGVREAAVTTLCKVRHAGPEMEPSPDSVWPETKTCSRGSFLCLLGPEESIGFPKAPAGGGQCRAGGAGAGHPGEAGTHHHHRLAWASWEVWVERTGWGALCSSQACGRVRSGLWCLVAAGLVCRWRRKARAPRPHLMAFHTHTRFLHVLSKAEGLFRRSEL